MPRSTIDMMQALSLTRQGRLAEAMAALRGEAIDDDSVPGRTVEPTAGPVLDMVPPSTATGPAWTAPPTAAPSSTGQQSSGQAGRRLRPGAVAAAPAATLPAGASFAEHRFENAAGSRRYKLYVPSGYAGQPLPLVVMLHGCTQSPEDFAAGTRMNDIAEERMLLVAYPAQARSANASKCWNWFDERDQQRDRGEPSLIAGITRQVMRDVSVEPGRVYAAGLSAGGAAAAILANSYPDLYAAVGVHSGLACGAARDLPSAFTAMRQGAAGAVPARGPARAFVPTIVFHGDADTTVNPINADQIVAQASGQATLETIVTRGVAPGGLGFVRTARVDGTGRSLVEQWIVEGAGHAWSGGSAAGSYTDARGPDASRELIRFFLQHSTGR